MELTKRRKKVNLLLTIFLFPYLRSYLLTKYTYYLLTKNIYYLRSYYYLRSILITYDLHLARLVTDTDGFSKRGPKYVGHFPAPFDQEQ